VDRIRVGRGLRAIRRRRRWRQQDVAERAKCARSLIADAEAGRIGGMTLDRLVAIGEVLEADLDLVVRWRGERIDRLVDEAHAALVESVVRLLTHRGWICEVEATFSIWGERGAIDVLAARPDLGIVLVVEVKSVFGDLQATASALDRKLRLAPVLARGRRWRARAIGGLIVVAGSRSNRRVVERHRETFEVLFPIRQVAAKQWLRAPVAEDVRMLLFLPAVAGGDLRQRSRIRTPDAAG
jgi:transcriptional regulator with XRE-family HTH domain